ncbi:hypothetical protein ACLOJK_002905 [Asimina triloba]
MKGNCGGGGCLDAEAPMRISFKKLHQWPESEVEFLLLVTRINKEKEMSTTANMGWHDERYSSRQKYLRSYTFSRKESVAEKTRRLFLKGEKALGKKGKKEMRNKEKACWVLGAVFKCLFACIATVDV